MYDDLKIVVFNKEKVLKPLFALLDSNSEEYYHLSQISKKVIDLEEVFLNKEYYHPSFKGSSYLKDICKITAPGTYQDLDIIKTGIQVSNFHKEMTRNGKSLSEDSINTIYSYLTKDTLAITKTFIFILGKLKTWKGN